MESLYEEVLKSRSIVPSDQKSRKPLTGADRGAGIRLESNKMRTCDKCKLGTPDSNNPEKGQCVAFKNKMGAIWKRFIPDFYNMSCDHFTEGERDFRSHV